MTKLAEDKFKEASEAYGILSDKEKKQNYDNFGHAAFENGGGRQSGGFGGFGGQIFQIFLKIFLVILVVVEDQEKEVLIIEAQI